MDGRMMERKHWRKTYKPALTLFRKVFISEHYAYLLHYQIGYFAKLSGKADNFFLKLECLQNYSLSHFVSVQLTFMSTYINMTHSS